MSKKPLRILIVDDSSEDRELFRRLIQKGIDQTTTIVEAESGQAGLEIFLAESPDCVLLDYNLPDINGLEFITHCRETESILPVVMLTGEGSESVAVNAIKCGAQDYLVKSAVTSAELQRAIFNAIEKTQLSRKNQEYEREINRGLQAARDIQKGLLPQSPQRCGPFEIAGASYPAIEVGGDYFDRLDLVGEGIGIVVGDVAGHGFGPALLVASIHSYIRALSRTEYDLGHLFGIANALFLERTPEDMYASLFLARFDKKDKSLIYASAGHPNGYVFNVDGEVRDVLPSTGTLLGCLDDAVFQTSPRIPLQSGDIVLLMTDGILEAFSPDGQAFGTERALEVVRNYSDASAKDIVEAVCSAGIEFGQFAPQDDDMTVVVARVVE